MPQYKVQHIFNDCRYGWSETWYLDIAQDRQNAIGRAKILADARALLLGKPVYLEAVHVTQLDLNRGCSVVPYKRLAGFNATGDDADTPWNGWQAEVMAGNYCRQFILRGVPDRFIQRLSINFCDYEAPTQWTDAYRNFRNMLVQQSFALRVILQPPDGPAPIDIGVTITEAIDGTTVFSIPALTGVRGKKVKFTNWEGPDSEYLNGVWKILSNASPAVNVDMPFAGITQPGANTGGKAWAQVIGYKVITDSELVRVSGRKTGRAFFVRRGRRPRPS